MAVGFHQSKETAMRGKRAIKRSHSLFVTNLGSGVPLLLFYPVRYWVQPTLKGRWLHRDLNGMM
jgi:hypothetical protein